jgi:hypothetical protein
LTSVRSTRLRMRSNNLVRVPNAKLAQAMVVDHQSPSHDLAVLSTSVSTTAVTLQKWSASCRRSGESDVWRAGRCARIVPFVR